MLDHTAVGIATTVCRWLLAGAVVVALMLSAAGAGHSLITQASGLPHLSGSLWAALPSAGTATDLGTEYDPFVIGWRAPSAVGQHRSMPTASRRDLSTVETGTGHWIEPATE